VILGRAFSGKDVDQRELHECREYKHHACRHPNVDGFGVGDAWYRLLRRRQLSGDGEHGCDAERDSSRHRVAADPKGDP